MSSDEETAMIRETVAKFVDRELIPLEPHYLKSKLPGSEIAIAELIRPSI